MDQRAAALRDWASEQLNDENIQLAPASADASFRRYFRVHHDKRSYILMDAPPPQEDVRPFVAVARALLQADVHVPQVLAEDVARGFLLLSDLGNQTYLNALNASSVDQLYGDALMALHRIQRGGPGEEALPSYDQALLLREMRLFSDWLIGQYLQLPLDDVQDMLEEVYRLLAESALTQPRVCVHRDYHSRNLMLLDENNPGILDFQDAVFGPITYDLVSLLRDCYIRWPKEQVEGWALRFREQAIQSGVLQPDQADEATFLRWFDLMGVQRHLKASGIFARLFVRDAKPGYLADIPRTLGYITEVAPAYPALAPLATLIEERVMPQLKSRIARDTAA